MENLGRTPLNCVTHLDRGIAKERPNSARAENKSQSAESQQQRGGNRCGHNNKNLKSLILAQDRKRRPHSIEESMRRIHASLRDENKYPGLLPFFYHNAENGGRHRRSEGVESVLALVMSALVYDCVLQTMQYGQYMYNTNSFHYFGYARLVDVTGIPLWRVKRAMATLQGLGYVHVNQVVKELNDGRFVTDKVVITISEKIFIDLEMYTAEFLRDREKAAQKYHDRTTALENKARRLQIYAAPSTMNQTNRQPKNKRQRMNVKDLTTVTNNLLAKNKPQQPRGNSAQQLTMYNNLIRKGVSPKDAIAMIAQHFQKIPIN